jgi:hypothetical protein
MVRGIRVMFALGLAGVWLVLVSRPLEEPHPGMIGGATAPGMPRPSP